MKRVFVYEYLSGGGTQGEPSANNELMPMGLAMRDAMALDLLRCAECTVTVACQSGTHLTPAGAMAVSARAGEAPLEFVARQALLHDVVWLVAPETGGWLQRFAQAVDASRWLGCSGAAIALASSKRATLERLAAQGLATPLACTDDASVRRWVVKPDDGAGALATRVHGARASAYADLAQRERAGTPACLEPWVEGQALSLSLLCDGSRCELLSVNRQRLLLAADGALSFAGVEVNVIPLHDARRTALAALAAQAARAIPGLRGFVGIDLVWHAQRGPVVIEVNPRVTSAYVGLSAALGRNLAAELLAAQRARVAHV